MHGGTVSERPPVLTTRLPVQHPVSDRCRSIHKEVTKNKKTPGFGGLLRQN